MENLELTHEEKNELEKRGFFVKDIITLIKFLSNIPMQFLFLLLSICIWSLAWGANLILWYSNSLTLLIDIILLSTTPIILLTLRSWFWYIFFSKIFHKDNWLILFKNLIQKWKDDWVILNLFNKIQWFNISSRKAFKKAKESDKFNYKYGYWKWINNTLFDFLYGF